jgi:hypothetical protein
MSLFEYVAIAFSLIFSFAVLRLVGGISHVLDPGRRYWVHAAHVCFQLLATAVSFWIMFSYRDVEWTLPGFLLVLVIPALFYFNANVLIPEAPASIESWRVHYFAIRKRYWIAVCLWTVVTSITSTTLLEVPIVHHSRAVQLLIFAFGVGGIVSASPRVHETLAILTCLLPITALFFASLPAPLAQ